MKTTRDKTIRIALFMIGLQACTGGVAATNSQSEPNDAGLTVDPSPPSTPPTNTVGRKAYIGLFGDEAVGVLDVDAMHMVTTLHVTAPDGLIITPDGKKVFVSSTDTGTVKVISTDNDSITASIDVGAKPAGIAISPDGRLVVVSVGGADEAVVIDANTNTIVRHVSVGQAHSSCITADSKYAYVGSQVSTAPAVVKIALDEDEAPKTFPVDKSPRALACEADRIYFTAVGLDAVEVLDPVTGALTSPITTAGSPHDVRAAQPGQTELVVSQTAGDLEFIDLASATVVAKVPTGKLAHWIVVTKDRQTAYVTNEGDNNVSVVDLATRAVSDTIPVGKAPRKIALQP